MVRGFSQTWESIRHCINFGGGRACSLVKCVKSRIHASLHISQGGLRWKAFKIRNGLPDSWNRLLPQLEMIPQVFTFFRLKARFLKLDHKGVNVSENDLKYYIISAESHLCYVGCSLVTVVQVGGVLKKRCSHPFFDFQSFFLKESRCLSSPLTFPPKRGHSQSALRQIYKVNSAIEFSISSFACATSFVRQQL